MVVKAPPKTSLPPRDPIGPEPDPKSNCLGNTADRSSCGSPTNLAKLDIRQESARHTQLISEIIKKKYNKNYGKNDKYSDHHKYFENQNNTSCQDRPDFTPEQMFGAK